MQIRNVSKNTFIAREGELAEGFWARAKGLLGRACLKEGEGLVIPRCCSIHMFFMRFAIDALFVDERNYVVGLTENLRPFRLSPVFLKANFVIEVPAGTIKRSCTAIGDLIKLGE
ncbi:MAG TPA: DUF192 domain-containing protein [Candidatus Omnitrophota bacterium]|nr:DUF192 domain-containing protein [Candidatus Omnitrophota bacterium]HPD84620.1 DUF192 domain-containing protein [Candidatus Omnitrophota bacterium]HRZ03478.1 DUF192 domain-containing protein [Candidatus Omnitrophota bacterium]